MRLAPLLSRAAFPPLVANLALGCFTAGLVGFWFFAERIGSARGVPPAVIGTTISLCAFSTIVSAALVAWSSKRLPGYVSILGGTLIALVGFAALSAPGDLAYVASVFLFSWGYGMAQPGYWATARKVDLTGRLFVASPAAGGVAGVLIGLTAGPLIQHSGYDGLILCCAILLIVGGVLLALASLLAAAVERLAPWFA